MKEKVCAQCKLKHLCEGLPGFCMFIPYIAIAAIVVLIVYFILNSKL